MASSKTSLPSLSFSSIFLALIIFSSSVQAVVPPSKTFKFINQGEFGDYVTEYGASYRLSDVATFPFQLCFYNTTPDAFTLALRMGHPRSESTLRWVWDANRGNPVRENATLTFGSDGNLVLADADGRIVWQTGTANKGVVDLKLLSNGNLVLVNARGRFVWQSFNYPTDTLFVGQALRFNGPNKLVSRVSDVDGSEGRYSFVMEQQRLALYLKSKNSPKPLLYYATEEVVGGSLTQVVFQSAPERNARYEIRYDLFVNNKPSGSRILASPNYNSSLSILRLGSDGNLKVYTYNDKVDIGAWEVTYTLFNRNGRESECRLPSRCGSFGVCEDDQCVACPRPQGLAGWSRTCEPPRLPPCRANGANVNYYKVVGVEHFTNGVTEGEGPINVGQCRARCDKDCGCLGFFYREESSKCLLVPELGTLTKVSNAAHVAYIKKAK